MKLRSLLGALFLALAIMLSLPSITFAKSCHDKGSHASKHKKSNHKKYKKWSWNKDSCDKGSKGSNNKGSKGSCDKGSKGSHDKGSKDSCGKGSKDSNNKGSKGSCDKGSKGSHDKGSKGSCDKGSTNTPKENLIGNLVGTVYEDSNNNGSQDNNETGVANITITIIDANGKTLNVTTDNVGKYTVNNLPEGPTVVTVDETTLPPLATLTAGVNPSDITIIANTENDAGKDGYILPDATGSLVGTVYEDSNNNGSQDNNETGVANITITIMDANGKTLNVTTDNVGNYTVNDLPEGPTVVTVDETTLPPIATLTAGVNPSDITIIANTENDAGKDGYIFSVAVGSIHGQVVVSGQGYAGVTLNIIDTDGNIHPVVTDNNGNWTLTGIVVGDSIVDVDETTLPEGLVRSIGIDRDVFTILENQDINAGIDGYIIYVP